MKETKKIYFRPDDAYPHLIAYLKELYDDQLTGKEREWCGELLQQCGEELPEESAYID